MFLLKDFLEEDDFNNVEYGEKQKPIGLNGARNSIAVSDAGSRNVQGEGSNPTEGEEEDGADNVEFNQVDDGQGGDNQEAKDYTLSEPEVEKEPAGSHGKRVIHKDFEGTTSKVHMFRKRKKTMLQQMFGFSDSDEEFDDVESYLTTPNTSKICKFDNPGPTMTSRPQPNNFFGFLSDAAEPRLCLERNLGKDALFEDVFYPSWKIKKSSLLDTHSERHHFANHAIPPAKIAEMQGMSFDDNVELLDRIAVDTMVSLTGFRQHYTHMHKLYAEKVNIKVAELEAAKRKIASLEKVVAESAYAHEKIQALESLLEATNKYKTALEEKARKSSSQVELKDAELDHLHNKLAKKEFQVASLQMEKNVLLEEIDNHLLKIDVVNDERKEVITKVIPHVVKTLLKAPEYITPHHEFLKKAMIYSRHQGFIKAKEHFPDEPEKDFPYVSPSPKAELLEAENICENLSFPYIEEISRNPNLSVKELLKIVPAPLPST